MNSRLYCSQSKKKNKLSNVKTNKVKEIKKSFSKDSLGKGKSLDIQICLHKCPISILFQTWKIQVFPQKVSKCRIETTPTSKLASEYIIIKGHKGRKLTVSTKCVFLLYQHRFAVVSSTYCQSDKLRSRRLGRSGSPASSCLAGAAGGHEVAPGRCT